MVNKDTNINPSFVKPLDPNITIDQIRMWISEQDKETILLVIESCKDKLDYIDERENEEPWE